MEPNRFALEPSKRFSGHFGSWFQWINLIPFRLIISLINWLIHSIIQMNLFQSNPSLIESSGRRTKLLWNCSDTALTLVWKGSYDEDGLDIFLMSLWHLWKGKCSSQCNIIRIYEADGCHGYHLKRWRPAYSTRFIINRFIWSEYLTRASYGNLSITFQFDQNLNSSVN